MTKKEFAEKYCAARCSKEKGASRRRCREIGFCRELENTLLIVEKHHQFDEPKLVPYLKSKEKIKESLERLGYENKNGAWYRPPYPVFVSGMWRYCGEAVDETTFIYIPEWIEWREE